MTTISTASSNHLPLIPLPMASYAYRYPNHDSQPFNSFPDKSGVYNPRAICTYKWENHFPENHGETKLTYIGPDYFKEPPKHYALAPNWPKENYSPKFVDDNKLMSAKGYVPHFTNKTHSAWKKFLNETPERYELSAGANNDKIARLNSDLAKSKSFSYGLASGETANSGIGADFAQRPVMALTSQHRNNDGYRHTNLHNPTNWKPYGNQPTYFNNYIIGAPKFCPP